MRILHLFSIALATALPFPSLADGPSAADSIPGAGIFYSRQTAITIWTSGIGIAELHGDGWDAVGYFDGARFDGLAREIDDEGHARSDDYQLLQYELQPDGSIAATFSRADARARKRHERWTRRPEAILPLSPEEFPKFGEYAAPEAIQRVAPVYPALAREARIDGTVILEILVGVDGLVKDVRVIKSIPMLDMAAVSCARHWVFTPAMGNDESSGRYQPVAAWVAVPVKFSLH